MSKRKTMIQEFELKGMVSGLTKDNVDFQTEIIKGVMDYQLGTFFNAVKATVFNDTDEDWEPYLARHGLKRNTIERKMRFSRAKDKLSNQTTGGQDAETKLKLPNSASLYSELYGEDDFAKEESYIEILDLFENPTKSNITTHKKMAQEELEYTYLEIDYFTGAKTRPTDEDDEEEEDTTEDETPETETEDETEEDTEPETDDEDESEDEEPDSPVDIREAIKIVNKEFDADYTKLSSEGVGDSTDILLVGLQLFNHTDEWSKYFKLFAKVAHSDKGGSDEAMAFLNFLNGLFKKNKQSKKTKVKLKKMTARIAEIMGVQDGDS